MDIPTLLELLDGYGLVITDDELIQQRLEELDLSNASIEK